MSDAEPAVEPVEVPPNPDRENETDNGFKDVFRAHARWAIAEMQLAAEGVIQVPGENTP